MIDPPHQHPVLSDERLAELFANLADAVIIADPEGSIIYWNASATRLFGWSHEDALGQSLDIIIPERLRARHNKGYAKVMITGHTDYGTKLLEVPAVHKDGSGLSIAFTVSLIAKPGQAAPLAIVAVLRDETARWLERRAMKTELAALKRTTHEEAD
ncbi:MAG: PAS domain S-box protein [Ilumatobacteraceae bacterium]